MGRVVLFAVVLAGCGFTAASGGDSGTRDASGGGVDSDGTSVLDGPPGPIDAAPTIDAPLSAACITCQNHGGTCMGTTCVIDEDGPGAVMCPPGMPCHVICNQAAACKGGVDCGMATTCEVECIGAAACQDEGVDCGSAGTCDVTCRGAAACQHGPGSKSVDCSGGCTVTCDGEDACQDGINGAGSLCAGNCCDGACAGGNTSCAVGFLCF